MKVLFISVDSLSRHVLIVYDDVVGYDTGFDIETAPGPSAGWETDL